MEDLKQILEHILNDGYLLSLGTTDGAVPWVSDVVYAHDVLFNIYWLSSEGAKHSQNIIKNSVVAGTITVVGSNGLGRGIQIQGKAEKVKSDEMIFEIEKIYQSKRRKQIPQTIEKAKQLVGNRALYKLTPTKIFIHHEPLWGYERKEYL